NRMPAWKMSSLNSRRGTETYDQIYPGSGDAFCDQFYESAQRLKKNCLRTACGGHRPVHPAERRVDAFHNNTGGRGGASWRDHTPDVTGGCPGSDTACGEFDHQRDVHGPEHTALSDISNFSCSPLCGKVHQAVAD